MKTASILSIAALLASAGILQAQVPGPSLAPSGAPADGVFKTLVQVEPRTPLSAGQPGVSINGVTGTITISLPGSYYLTGNVTITTAGAKGIVISAQNVTLDLNGFSLICTSVNGGEALQTGNNSTVRNGKIVGGSTYNSGTATWTLAGWGRGLDDATTGVTVSDLTVSGTQFGGLSNQLGMTVERCKVHQCNGPGIVATRVVDCSITLCRVGINFAQLVQGCRLSDILLSGIDLSGNGVVSDCYVTSGSHGIHASSVTNCVAISNTGIGISATTVLNSSGTSTNSTGIFADSVTNSKGLSTSGIAINAATVTNCRGLTGSGTHGIISGGTVSFSQGSGVTAIQAAIAIGCTSGGGPITAPQKHLGTP